MELQTSTSFGDPRVQAAVAILRATGFVVTGLLGLWKVRRDRRHARHLAVPVETFSERLRTAEVRIDHLEQTDAELRRTASDLRALVDDMLMLLGRRANGGEGR